MKSDPQLLVDALRSSLEERGISQAELARRLKVTAQYVGQITKGKRLPTREKLALIEQVLGKPRGSLATLAGYAAGGRDGQVGRKLSLAQMPGIEVAYLALSMETLREARQVLLQLTPAEGMRRAIRGKKDTKQFDAACESVIVDKLRAFNDRCAIFTEESQLLGHREFASRTCYFVDPFDRSVPFASLLERTSHKNVPISEVVAAPTNPLTGLNAPFGSITCVRDGQISFNVMMDYCSGEVYVACKAMLRHSSIDNCPDPEALARYGKDTGFAPRQGHEFTCFLGERGSDKRTQYEKHLTDLEFHPGQLPADDLQDPGGPARILFLADDDIPGRKLACILSNGEKICEWFGWLAYVVHCNELAAYELHADNISARDQILLAPPPSYSMFQIAEDGRCKLNLERILVLDNPVFYRAAILVTHKESAQVTAGMRVLRCRELVLHHPG